MKAMIGVQNCQKDAVRLDLTVVSPPSMPYAARTLSIDEAETAETKIKRLISEHPVIIFTQSSCCMCHVMKKLLSTVGVNPTVIELDDAEISAVYAATTVAHAPPPAIFIGGACVGGLESLVSLHLSGHLVPRLVEVGALWV